MPTHNIYNSECTKHKWHCFGSLQAPEEHWGKKHLPETPRDPRPLDRNGEVGQHLVIGGDDLTSRNVARYHLRSVEILDIPACEPSSVCWFRSSITFLHKSAIKPHVLELQINLAKSGAPHCKLIVPLLRLLMLAIKLHSHIPVDLILGECSLWASCGYPLVI